jgi:hypothetical protein
MAGTDSPMNQDDAWRGGPPRCPKCGAEMILTKPKRPGLYHIGKWFYGCVRYPECKGAVAQPSNLPRGLG